MRVNIGIFSDEVAIQCGLRTKPQAESAESSVPRLFDGFFCCIVLKKSDKLCYKPFLLTTAVKLMRKHLFNGILTRNDESFRKNV